MKDRFEGAKPTALRLKLPSRNTAGHSVTVSAGSTVQLKTCNDYQLSNGASIDF